jgi:hypothetical protein
MKVLGFWFGSLAWVGLLSCPAFDLTLLWGFFAELQVLLC